MAKENPGMYLVGGSKKRLSASHWINRITKAFEKRDIPMEKFILVRDNERPGPGRSRQG